MKFIQTPTGRILTFALVVAVVGMSMSVNIEGHLGQLVLYLSRLAFLGGVFAMYTITTPKAQRPPYLLWVVGTAYTISAVQFTLGLYWAWRAEDIRRTLSP